MVTFPSHSTLHDVGSSNSAVKQANNETMECLYDGLQSVESERVMKSTLKYTPSSRIRTHDTGSLQLHTAATVPTAIGFICFATEESSNHVYKEST
jgi:hypothetical protein